jgi:hypothetical protein
MQGHTHGADIPAPVKGSQANSVFPGRHDWKVNGVSFQTAIGNSIIRKQWRPGRTVQAQVGLLNFAGCVSDFKQSSTPVFQGSKSAQNRWRVIYIHWFAQTLP